MEDGAPLRSLTLHGHDELVLFKLMSDEKLKQKFYTETPLDRLLLQQFVPKEIMKKLMEIERNSGAFSTIKTFIRFAITKKLKSGWSYALLLSLEKHGLEDLKNRISPGEEDYKEFTDRLKIPRGSLLCRISELLAEFGTILLSPMGVSESIEECERVPVVHPQLFHINYDDEYTNTQYLPSSMQNRSRDSSPKVSFADIMEMKVGPELSTDDEYIREKSIEVSKQLRSQHNLYLLLIGPAGSGKTTITKRIVTTCLKEGKMPFFVSFHRLSKSDRWSLKELLIKFPLIRHSENDPSDEEVEENFEWIVDNQDKCFLIIDGYDQSSFTISSQPISANMNDKLKPEDLFSLICSRRFLPQIRLILTSRPHAIHSFSEIIKPDHTIFVDDLEDKDMETLMKHYVTTNDSDKIIQVLQMKSPSISRLLNVPLFLRLIAMLSCESGAEVWSYINTASKLYYEIIERHQNSAHFGSEYSIELLDEKLMKMAFDATMDGRVVIYPNDLNNQQLCGSDVQDLIFSIMETSGQQPSSCLIGIIFYLFHHQTIQEFYTARHLVEKLQLDQFKEIVENFFPELFNHEWDEVYDEYWPGMPPNNDKFGMIRMFTIGCIDVLLDRDYDAHNQGRILLDLMDVRNSNSINEIRTRLSSCDFQLACREGKTTFPRFIIPQGERTAFSHFIQNYVTKADRLEFSYRDLHSEFTVGILTAIKLKIETIDELTIIAIRTHLQPGTLPPPEEVLSLFSKVSTKIKLGLPSQKNVHYYNPIARRYSEELKEAIEQFDTRRLLANKLSVEVFPDHPSFFNWSDAMFFEAQLTKGGRPKIRYSFDGSFYYREIGPKNEIFDRLFNRLEHA